MDLESELKRTLSECTSPSPLADALADKKLPFYVRNGAYPYAIDALDKGMEAHPDADSDPNYVPFMEMLALVLYKGENLVQADVILDRLRTHVQERGLPSHLLQKILNKTSGKVRSIDCSTRWSIRALILTCKAIKMPHD